MKQSVKAGEFAYLLEIQLDGFHYLGNPWKSQRAEDSEHAIVCSSPSSNVDGNQGGVTDESISEGS